MTTPCPRLPPVAITAFSTVNACGLGNAALLTALQKNEPCLAPLTLFRVPFPTVVGQINQSLSAIRPELAAYNSRNAQVALAALNYEADGLRAAIAAAKGRYGAARIGVIIGTSTSGLYESESAYAHLVQHTEMPDNFYFLTRHAYQATGRFLQLELGLSGVCFAVSTACSSGAKAIAAGQRLIASGVCDAVLVGGVDTLCRLTLRGFASLDLIATEACKPMDKQRGGINIGEAAALLLLEKSTSDNEHCPHLLAVGEASDAHHMSHPHPDGLGAIAAMQNALDLAGLRPEQMDYLNLHATATRVNDAVESKAVAAVFADGVPCSGTKGLTGHTLGAAGALEAIIALLSLQNDFMPGTCGLSEVDSACAILKEPKLNQSLGVVMSNSFGFGGNNASVIVGRPKDLSGFKNLTGLSNIFIKSSAVCCPDAAVLAQSGVDGLAVDLSLLPAALRRRTSLSTRLAITAATAACRQAHIDTTTLPSIFVSLGGEIQITDALCRVLANSDEWLSPTQFHNSVHNTAAGYWGILNHCQAASTAIAAADDGFAMGLIEAFSQLQQQQNVLLVCYDELWPQYLAAPLGKTAFACAFVLSRDDNGDFPSLSMPYSGTNLPGFKNLEGLTELIEAAPAAAALPLLKALKNQRSSIIPLTFQARFWLTQLEV